MTPEKLVEENAELRFDIDKTNEIVSEVMCKLNKAEKEVERSKEECSLLTDAKKVIEKDPQQTVIDLATGLVVMGYDRFIEMRDGQAATSVPEKGELTEHTFVDDGRGDCIVCGMGIREHDEELGSQSPLVDKYTWKGADFASEEQNHQSPSTAYQALGEFVEAGKKIHNVAEKLREDKSGYLLGWRACKNRVEKIGQKMLELTWDDKGQTTAIETYISNIRSTEPDN